MTFEVSIYDLISWGITIASVMLFIFERRKNNRTPYYMAVQGILRACNTKAGFYITHVNSLKNRDSENSTTVPMPEYLLFAENVYSDFATLMEHIMGCLKAIEPDKDMPFDTIAFTSRSNSNITKQKES